MRIGLRVQATIPVNDLVRDRYVLPKGRIGYLELELPA